MMKIKHSVFNPSKQYKDSISLSLNRFKNSLLSACSKHNDLTASKLLKSLTKQYKQIFIFAFGGSGMAAKITDPVQKKKIRHIHCIHAIDEQSLNYITSLSSAELKKSGFVFISKSGKTREALFYFDFLKKLYFKHKIPLKNKFNLITHAKKSPLLKQMQSIGSIIITKDELPGRFSFFSIGGLLQSKAHFSFWNTPPTYKKEHTLKEEKDITECFLYHCRIKKEIFCCSFDSQIKGLCDWLESSWSESLFGNNKKSSSIAKSIPLLRHISFYNLRHAMIQELITKKASVFFIGLADNSSINSPNSPSSKWFKKQTNSKDKTITDFYNFSPLLPKQQIKVMETLLNEQKIPYLFIELSLKNNLHQVIRLFYKILFCMGDFSDTNIYSQPWVDYLKKRL